MQKSLFQDLRKAFLAGLLVVIPLAGTLWVLVALAGLLEYWLWLVPGPLRPEQPFWRTTLGVLVTVALVLGVGYATRSFVGMRIIRISEDLLARVPVVSSLYLGIKQLLEAIVTTDKGYFQKVVLVQWPRKGLYAVAFHTGESELIENTRMVNVFMPSTPNPTTGFFFMLPEEDVVMTEMTVEQAFKLIMSAGIVAPPHKVELPLPDEPPAQIEAGSGALPHDDAEASAEGDSEAPEAPAEGDSEASAEGDPPEAPGVEGGRPR